MREQAQQMAIEMRDAFFSCPPGKACKAAPNRELLKHLFARDIPEMSRVLGIPEEELWARITPEGRLAITRDELTRHGLNPSWLGVRS